MGKEFLKFGDIEIKKQKFRSSKGLIDIGHVNIDKIVISVEFSWTKNCSRYFSCYQTIKKLHHYLSCSQNKLFCEKFDDTKTMCFLLKDKNHWQNTKKNSVRL